MQVANQDSSKWVFDKINQVYPSYLHALWMLESYNLKKDVDKEL